MDTLPLLPPAKAPPPQPRPAPTGTGELAKPDEPRPARRCSRRSLTIAAVVVALLFVAGASSGITYAVVQGQNVDPALPKNARICYASDATTATVRRHLGQVEGFTSCAIVGSAGFLRKQRLGEEIDAHEFVIRTNLSPVAGYEPIVGSKTSLRLLNSEAIGTTLSETICEEADADCPSYPVYINSNMHLHKQTLKRLCNATNWVGHGDVGQDDEVVHSLQNPNGNVMSGSWAVAFALRACPNGVDVYGVTHNGTRYFGRESSYHYYDDQRVNPTADNLPQTAWLLTRLANQQGECLRLHTPSVVDAHDEFQLPQGARSSPRDPWIDVLNHTKGGGEYYNKREHWCSG